MRVSCGISPKELLALLALAAGLAACSSEQSSPTPEVRDLDSVLAVTPSVEPQVLPTSPSTCINDARFVEDLTVPDGSVAAPGEVMDKRWAVLNAGTCDWGAGYRLVRIDDGPIDAPQELALYPARAGESGVWSIQIIAPQQSGDQVASWQAQSPDGAFFGDQVFVLIEVEG